MVWLVAVIGIAAAYLVGGFPSAIVVGKGIYGIDVREHGSHNMGTTNTIRTLGVKPGLFVAFLDIFKGAAGVLIMIALLNLFALDVNHEVADVLDIAAGIAAMVGHIKSPYLHFTGGKGVATAFGALCVIVPWAALVVLAVFLIVAFVGKIVSVATMSAALTLVIATPLFYPGHIALEVFALIVFAVIMVSHRSNIRRLIDHTEPTLHAGHAKTKRERRAEGAGRSKTADRTGEAGEKTGGKDANPDLSDARADEDCVRPDGAGVACSEDVKHDAMRKERL